MTSFLPDDCDYEQYWNMLYRRPLSFWQPALDWITAQHQLTPDGWERASLGRNVVFLSDQYVVKLSPPFWHYESPREADALRFVQGQLPVATPLLLATGTLGSWHYLVQTRLPGRLLRSAWPELAAEEKTALIVQHGAIMAAVHAIPVTRAPASLAFDWAGMLAAQFAECEEAMLRSGVSEHLLQGLEAYLAQAPSLLAQDPSYSLIHGDLDAINLLVEQQGAEWQITGLVDWGDIKLGPVAHEFISPRVHMYRAEPGVLEPWYASYGPGLSFSSPEVRYMLMARTMIYYADEFRAILQAVPGAAGCRDWEAVEACFWKPD